MAINVSQPFHRTSGNPVDETLALTKAQMLATDDNLMPSKYMTVCQDDGKLYLYDKSNTADPTTGKFRAFEGGGSGGDGGVVSGYAYASPISSMADFISRVNAASDFPDITYTSGIFDGKTANQICIFQTATTYYLLFSEYDFDISALQVSQDSTLKCSISRKTLDGSSHPGYRATGALSSGITSLSSVTIASDWEFDIAIADANKTGLFFVTSTVGFDERYNSYNSNTYIMDGIQFYEDSAHTTPITPEMGKVYVDLVSGDIYKWDGKTFTIEGGSSGTSDYTDLENKPSIEGVPLTGNKTAADLGLAKSNQIPTVPTKVSQLQNDSGFITNSDLPGVYAGDTAGLVPAAGSDNEGKYLDNDGNWTDPLDPFVQISGGKVLVDIPKNTYASYILAFNAIIDVLDTLSYEQLSSIVLRFGLNYFAFGRTQSNRSNYSFFQIYITSTENNYGLMRLLITAKDMGIHIGRWDFATSNTNPTYVNEDKSSAAQDSSIQLIDTSVSATMIGTINRSDIYDTTEKVVGKWTDGKPVYQCTFTGTISYTTANNRKFTALGLNNIDNIVSISGYSYTGTAALVIPYGVSGDGVAVFYDKSSNDASIVLQSATTGTWTYYLTMCYTKTTDAANSYNYADENDYSTSEKIIGKWIDGNPVYQRTFVENITSPTSGSTTTNFDLVLNIPNLDNVIKVDLTGKINDTSNVIMPLPLKNASKSDVLTADFYRYKKSGNTPIIELTATAAGAGNSLVAYITVQYTKTS